MNGRFVGGFVLLALGCAAPSAPPSAALVPFEARGRLVCLAEEMKSVHRADVPPVHEHLWGFRIDPPPAAPAPRYATILRTPMAEALFVDERFRHRELKLFGRRFPDGALLEVSGIQWVRDGALYDVFYWCRTCAIKGFDPSTCACCQEPVELREEPAGKN
jgi:hypothetical protein